MNRWTPTGGDAQSVLDVVSHVTLSVTGQSGFTLDDQLGSNVAVSDGVWGNQCSETFQLGEGERLDRLIRDEWHVGWLVGS